MGTATWPGFLLTYLIGQFACIEMTAACIVANAPMLYRLIVEKSQKMQSSAQTSRSSGNESPGYWFSVNRSVRRTRQPIENDEFEFTGLREAPMAVGLDSGKNTSSVDVQMWEADEGHVQEEPSWEWGTDAATTVAGSDHVESVRAREVGSHEQERHQLADHAVST